MLSKPCDFWFIARVFSQPILPVLPAARRQYVFNLCSSNRSAGRSASQKLLGESPAHNRFYVFCLQAYCFDVPIHETNVLRLGMPRVVQGLVQPACVAQILREAPNGRTEQVAQLSWQSLDPKSPIRPRRDIETASIGPSLRLEKGTLVHISNRDTIQSCHLQRRVHRKRDRMFLKKFGPAGCTGEKCSWPVQNAWACAC